MILKEYLNINGLTYQEFADKIGIHRQTIVNLLSGKDIKLSIAAKIEDATLGIVKCRELYLDHAEHKEQKKNRKEQQQNE